MRIKTIILAALMLLMAMPVQVAARPSLLEATYEEALRQALHRSPTLVPIERELRQIAVQIREAEEMRVFHINENPPLSDFYVSEYMRLNIEQVRLRLERDRYRLATEHSLRAALSAIAGLKLDMELLEASLEFQQKLLTQTQLRLQHGMASQLELREAERTLEESRLNLEMLLLQLASENQNLSQLINRHITTPVTVEYDHKTLPPVPDEEERPYFIERQTVENPNYIMRILEAERARHDWQRQLEDPEVDNVFTRLQFDLAVLNRAEARRQAEAAAVAAFTGWDRLQEQRVALDSALEQAQQERESMLSRYEAGLITALQADASLLELMSAEIAIEKWYYDAWQARIWVDHPYMR